MSIWESIKKRWNSFFNKEKALPEGEELNGDWEPIEGAGVGEVITPEEPTIPKDSVELNPDLSEIHQIGVLDAPMGEGRHDKSVYLKTKDNTYTRTSNIMMGKKESSLTDKSYINLEEVEKALENYILAPEDETIKNVIVKAKKTGRRVSTNKLKSLVKEAVTQKGELLVAGGMPTIQNQDTASLYVKEEGEKDFTRKGVMFLGKDKIELPTGEYVSEEEIRKALKEYMLIVEKREPDKKEEVKEELVEEPKAEEKLEEAETKPEKEPEEQDVNEAEAELEEELKEIINNQDKFEFDDEELEEKELEKQEEKTEVHKVVSRKKLPDIKPVLSAIGSSVMTFIIGTDTIEAEMLRNRKLAKEQGTEVEKVVEQEQVQEPIIEKPVVERKVVSVNNNDRPQNIPESRRKYVEEWKKIRKDEDDLDR